MPLMRFDVYILRQNLLVEAPPSKFKNVLKETEQDPRRLQLFFVARFLYVVMQEKREI